MFKIREKILKKRRKIHNIFMENSLPIDIFWFYWLVHFSDRISYCDPIFVKNIKSKYISPLGKPEIRSQLFFLKTVHSYVSGSLSSSMFRHMGEALSGGYDVPCSRLFPAVFWYSVPCSRLIRGNGYCHSISGYLAWPSFNILNILD